MPAMAAIAMVIVRQIIIYLLLRVTINHCLIVSVSYVSYIYIIIASANLYVSVFVYTYVSFRYRYRCALC